MQQFRPSDFSLQFGPRNGSVLPWSFFRAGAKDSKGVDTVFDDPACFTLRDVFAHGKNLDTLIKTIADDRLYPDAASLVTIFGDHDVPRFMSEPGAKVEGSWNTRHLLRRRDWNDGGGDPDNRHDFPAGWAGDSHTAFEKAGRTPPEAAILISFRN